ncbi:unnamed protein product [Closterium sp. NIES-54]
MQRIAEGRSYRQIAQELGVSKSAVHDELLHHLGPKTFDEQVLSPAKPGRPRKLPKQIARIVVRSIVSGESKSAEAAAGMISSTHGIMEWEKIPAAWCSELIDSMPRRVRAVLKAKGRWTNDYDNNNTKGGRGRLAGCRPCRKSKQSTSAKDADSSSGVKGRGDKEASCSLVGVVEPTVLLAPEAGEDFQAVAATVQANPAAVLFDRGCSHHLMGTKEVFVDLGPCGDVKHGRGFNRTLRAVQGCRTVALRGEAGKKVLILDVLYVPGMHANLLSVGQLKESGVKLQDERDGMLTVSVAGDVLGRATYTGRVLYIDLHTCTVTSTSTTLETVALRTIATATKLTPAKWHVRLAHVGVDTITSLAKHEVAIGLDVKPLTGTDSPRVLCVGRKLARHTFPDKGSDADDALAVMHIDLCGPFWVAANDGSLYFLLLKDRKTRYVWVRPVAKTSDVLREFKRWLVVVERQTKKSVLMLRSDQGGEFLGRNFTNFVDGKGIVHNLICPYTPQKNAPLVAPRSALGCLGEELLGEVDAVAGDDTAPAVNQQEARLDTSTGVGLHGAVPRPRAAMQWKVEAEGQMGPSPSEESKGWELLDLTDNRVVTTSDVVFYETMSLEVWKSEHGPASGRTQVKLPTDTSTATLPLLAEVDELADEDADVVRPPSPSPFPPAPPLVADLRKRTSTLASGDEGSSGALLVVLAKSIAGGRCDATQVAVGEKLTPTGEQ